MFEVGQRVVNTHPMAMKPGERGTVVEVRYGGIHVRWDGRPLTTYYKNKYLRGESSWVTPLDCNERKKENSMSQYTGKRVFYNNPDVPNRMGWTGTILRGPEGTINPYITVAWDQQPDNPTRYRADALLGDNAYLILDDSQEDVELYLVAGEKGGRVHRVHGYDAAVTYAERAAGDSKSGQPYLIFKAQERVERAQPPVTRTKL